MLIKQAVDFLYLCPPMKCAVNWALNSLKVLTELGNQCGWRDRQDCLTPVPWKHSSSPSFVPSSLVSPRRQGVESCLWGMGCLHFAAPVGSRRYCLPVLRGLAAQHWNLLGLLQYYCLPSNVVALPKPDFALWGIQRPLSGSALASLKQSVAARLPKCC